MGKKREMAWPAAKRGTWDPAILGTVIFVEHDQSRDAGLNTESRRVAKGPRGAL